ncbi:TMA20 [Sanghuangporus sanghuang]
MFKRYDSQFLFNIGETDIFGRFTQSEISSQSILKSSAQRAIRSQLLEQLSINAETLEQIWPKKEPLILVKCKDRISLYVVNGEPLFFQQFDEQLYPTLRLLHKYPDILPRLQVDRGAIRHLLAGANMMCPGFTSAGGRLPPEEEALPAQKAIGIFCEGKEHAAGVGVLKLGTEEIKKTTKGVGAEVKSYLGDGLWHMEKIGK